VTFNDHEGSTKSYAHTRRQSLRVLDADFVPPAEEIVADYAAGSTLAVRMHDGGVVRFSKVAADYDPRDRVTAFTRLSAWQAEGVVATGLLFIDEDLPDMHETNATVPTPLAQMAYEDLCPGSATLAKLMEEYR
jgi:2-oxoglutarate ferredoxin oxidoreductase subunit beta